MNAITVNTFPSLNAFTSARSWFLALIVLLHMGFFWALSNGLSLNHVLDAPNVSVLIAPQRPSEPPPKPLTLEPVEIRPSYAPVPPAPPNVEFDEGSNAIQQTIPLASPPIVDPRAHEPALTEPRIDPRGGVTQPVYPPAAVRGNEAGTVILAIHVLENGRVGEVRIEQSSGYPLLDEAAAREARKWRLTPGTRDGAPVSMWKIVPVTFRLQDGVRF